MDGWIADSVVNKISLRVLASNDVIVSMIWSLDWHWTSLATESSVNGSIVVQVLVSASEPGQQL